MNQPESLSTYKSELKYLQNVQQERRLTLEEDGRFSWLLWQVHMLNKREQEEKRRSTPGQKN